MPAFDDEIDQLYQLPPGEFTAGRNALAKRAGPAGAAIRKLPKPQLAAWAVNQLYWRHRLTFDRLLKASEAMRAAHRKLVAGEPVDLRAAEAAHRELLAQATHEARAVLREAGGATSQAVLGAVTDTLRALPADEPLGRLSAPLTPASGFEAFAGVVPRAPGKAAPKAVAKAKPALRLQKGAATEAARAKEIARETAGIEAELEEARSRVRDAEQALAALGKSLERAERERARRQTALDEAAAEVRDLTGRISRARQSHEEAAHERERLERRLTGLKRD